MTSIARTFFSQLVLQLPLATLLICGLAGCEDATTPADSGDNSAAGTPAANQAGDAEADNGMADNGMASTAQPADDQTNATETNAGDALPSDPGTASTSSAAGTGSTSNSNNSGSAAGALTNGGTVATEFVGVTKEELESKLGSDGVYELTFDDIKFDMETGGDFEREMIGDPIESLAGKRIRIRGYIYPTTMQRPKSFILVRDNMECCFGPGAALYDCVRVEMKPPKQAEYTTRPVAVEGTFSVEIIDFDGMVMSIYRLDADSAQ